MIRFAWVCSTGHMRARGSRARPTLDAADPRADLASYVDIARSSMELPALSPPSLFRVRKDQGALGRISKHLASSHPPHAAAHADTTQSTQCHRDLCGAIIRRVHAAQLNEPLNLFVKVKRAIARKACVEGAAAAGRRHDSYHDTFIPRLCHMCTPK